MDQDHRNQMDEINKSKKRAQEKEEWSEMFCKACTIGDGDRIQKAMKEPGATVMGFKRGFKALYENNHVTWIRWAMSNEELIKSGWSIQPMVMDVWNAIKKRVHLETVKVLLNEPSGYLTPSGEVGWDWMLFQSNARDGSLVLETLCEQGDVEKIKYFLNSPDLDPGDKKTRDGLGGVGWIPAWDNGGYEWGRAVMEGRLEVVKYILTDMELEPEEERPGWPNRRVEEEWMEELIENLAVLACECEQLEVLKYLLTSSDLDPQNKNIRNGKGGVGWPASDGLVAAAARTQSMKVIRWLIMEYGLEVGDVEMKKFPFIEDMVRARQENKMLQEQMNKPSEVKKNLFNDFGNNEENFNQNKKEERTAKKAKKL